MREHVRQQFGDDVLYFENEGDGFKYLAIAENVALSRAQLMRELFAMGVPAAAVRWHAENRGQTMMFIGGF